MAKSVSKKQKPPFKKAKYLNEILRATDPSEALPSGDSRYVDCREARGNKDFVRSMQLIIDEQNPGDHTSLLFTGHRGSGKSTELFRLKARLEESKRYVVFYIESSEFIDINDVVYSDIVLLIASQVTQEMVNLKLPIDEKLLEEVRLWFSEEIVSHEDVKNIERALEVEAGLGVNLPSQLPFLARLFTRVTGQIQTGDQIKHSIRQKLDPQISQLIRRTNELLDAVQNQLGKQLVIMVDNLDRIPLIEISPDHTNHDAIYLDHGDQLKSLHAHIIYTIPISMCYSNRFTVLRAAFPYQFILPMIRTVDKNDQEDSLGLEKIRDIVAERLEIQSLFEPAAAELLYCMSGGFPRQLMLLIRYARLYALEDRWPQPINREAVERAVQDLKNDYKRSIPQEHYPHLVKVYLDKKIRSDNLHRQMLYNSSVLEYYNGDNWQNVNPVVSELPDFQGALQDERRERGIPTL